MISYTFWVLLFRFENVANVQTSDVNLSNTKTILGNTALCRYDLQTYTTNCTKSTQRAYYIIFTDSPKLSSIVFHVDVLRRIYINANNAIYYRLYMQKEVTVSLISTKS